MSDDADHAQRLEEMQRAHALRAQAKRAQGEICPATIDCIVCGEPIGRRRRRVHRGATRCVECQDKHERAERRR